MKPNQKLADALKSLKRMQDKHRGVIDSGDLKEAQRVLLVEEGFPAPRDEGMVRLHKPPRPRRGLDRLVRRVFGPFSLAIWASDSANGIA
jgi:hypothetical protein